MIPQKTKNDKLGQGECRPKFPHDVQAMFLNAGNLPPAEIDEVQSIADFVRDALRRNVLGGRSK
jgi:hypothetical protein